MCTCGSGGWKSQRERSTRTRRALHGDIAIHRAGEIAADREAEAGPFLRARERAAELNEGIEDHVLHVLRHAGPRIAHVDRR
jgi:hypothetical protein